MRRPRFSFLRLLALLLPVLLPGVVAAQTLRFSELKIAGDEFVEIAYAGFGTPSNLSAYTLASETLAPTALPAYVLSGSGLVVVHLGSGTPSGNAVYMGLPADRLADSAGAVVLTRIAGAVPQSYFSWGAYAPAPPSPLVFPASYSIADGFYAAGDSLALIGTDPANRDHWINRRGAHITPGAANTAQTPPAFTYNVASLPATAGCDPIALGLTFTHTDEAPLRSPALTFTLPAGFLYVSSSDSGAFNNATRTVTWTTTTPFGAQALVRTVTVRPDTALTTGAFPAGQLGYSYLRHPGDPSPVTGGGANAIASFAIEQPSLSVSIVNHANPANGYIVTQEAGIIAFLVKVTNGGPGNLVGGGATVSLDLPASGLSFLTARVGGPTGSAVSGLASDLANQDFIFLTGPIAAGATQDYYVQARVLACGNLSPVVGLERECSDAAPGAVTSTQTLPPVTFPVYCDVKLDVTFPPGPYTAGQPIPVTLKITNDNAAALDPQDLVLKFHPGFYVDSIKRGGVDVGVYDPAATPDKTITLSAAHLGGALPPGDTVIDIVLKPSCSVPNDRKLDATLRYTNPAIGLSPVFSVFKQSLGVQVVLPALTVAVEDPLNPGQTTVRASRGETVLFLVTVQNNGSGDLSAAYAKDGGALLSFGGIGAALDITDVRDVTGVPGPYTDASGAPVTLTPLPPIGPGTRWNTGTVNAGASRRYLLVVDVQECADLSASLDIAWGVAGLLNPAADTCTDEGDSAGSIDIELRTPALNITAPAFTVDYCDGGEATVTLANTGDTGAIRDLVLAAVGLNPAAFDIAVTSGPFTFTPSYNNPGHPAHGQPAFVSTATPPAASIPGNASVAFTYTAKIKNGACNVPGATVTYRPYYEDDCGIRWTAGSRASSLGVGARPGTVSGGMGGPGFAEVGSTGLAYPVTLNFIGTPNAPFSYTVTVSYPAGDGFTYAGTATPVVTGTPGTTAAVADTGANPLVVTVSGTFDANGDYTGVLDLRFNAPTDPAKAGAAYCFTPGFTIPQLYDCNGCPLPTSFPGVGSVCTSLNSGEPGGPDPEPETPERIYHWYDYTHANGDVHPATSWLEACGGGDVLVQHLHRFAGPAPASWAGIKYTDALSSTLDFPPGWSAAALEVEVYYISGPARPLSPSGTNYGPGPGGTGNVPPGAVTWTQSGGTAGIEIDLSSLEGVAAPPSSDSWLWIRYKMTMPSDATGSIGSTAAIVVPNPNAPPPTLSYALGTGLEVVETTADVTITDLSGIVDPGAPATFRFRITEQDGYPFDLHQTQLAVDIGNWTYNPGSVTFVGLRDAANNLIPAREPDNISGTVLTWNLGNLSGGGHLANAYIQITFVKNTDPGLNDPAGTEITATATSRDLCDTRAETNTDTYNDPVVPNTNNSLLTYRREVTYPAGSPAETCTEIVIDHYGQFALGVAPNTWAGIAFDDILNAGYSIPGGNLAGLQLEVYYFDYSGTPSAPSGPDRAASVAVDLTPSGPDDRIRIDFSGLQAALSGSMSRPRQGGWLWLRYRLRVDADAPASTTEWASITIPGSSQPYQRAVVLNAAPSVGAVALQNLDGVVDKCEPVTFRVRLGAAHGFDVYDARLVLDLGSVGGGSTRWLYDPSIASISFVGLEDENGSIGFFYPDRSGPNNSILTWNLGDLSGLPALNAPGDGAYIQITLTKSCDDSGSALAASLYTRDLCADGADASLPALTAPGDFTSVRTATYAPAVEEGILSTLFTNELVYYNDGYPRIRFDIVNSGNGTLRGVKVPLVLGNPNPSIARSLSYDSARVSKVINRGSAQVWHNGVPVGTGSFPAIVRGTEDTSPVVAASNDAHREVVFMVDEMPPGSLVTIEVTLRMHLCVDLVAAIDNARWGCGGSSCGPNVQTNKQQINIAQGTTRVYVLEHSANPAVLDFCGSRTRFTLEIVNVGAVDVYEPIIREQLPPGLTLVPGTVRYAIDSGGGYHPGSTYATMAAFPLVGGNDYTSLVVSGQTQTIEWNFTDPNNNNDEIDSLLTGTAHSDPRPGDPNFARSRVLKPGQRIRLMFDAVLDASPGCDAAIAYYQSSRTATATIAFDLPCNHDNAVTATGASVAGNHRAPLHDNTKDSNFLDPGAADVLLGITGQNLTQTGSVTNAQVNGETGNALEWTFTMQSLGPGAVPQASLEVVLPAHLAFGTAALASPTPAHIQLVNPAPPVAETLPDGSRKYIFTFNNTDPFMVAQGRQSYLGAADTVVLKLQTALTGCAATLSSVQGTVKWGCCDDPVLNGIANGSDTASVDLKTTPDAPLVTIVPGGVPPFSDFATCGGHFTITIQNPGTNRELSLHDLHLALPIPAGFAYDPSNGGSAWAYSLTGGGVSPRIAAAAELLPAEEEPQIDGSTLRWRSTADGGNIPPAKARIFPRETVTITVYFKIAAGGPYCDTNLDSDPVIPNFTQGVAFDHKNSCGGSLPQRTASIAVDPKSPNLNIAVVPSPVFIDGATPTVQWTVTIRNDGDADADASSLELIFGNGYSTVSQNSGAAWSNLASNVATWLRNPPTLPLLSPGQTHVLTFTATVNTGTRGDLSLTATVDGMCKDRDGVDVCTYSLDRRIGYVAGAAITKVIDGAALSLPAVSTPAPGVLSDTANLAIGSIVRYLVTVELYEGGASTLRLDDTLPAGLTFLQAAARRTAPSAIGWAALANSGSGNNLVFTSAGNAILANNAGGAVFEIEIWAQVANIPANVAGATKVNTATLTIDKGTGLNAVTYTHNDHPALRDTATATLIEPALTSPTKVSVPASGTFGAPHVINLSTDPDTIAYTLTVTNTGTAPAYETVLADAVPFGLTVSSATVTRNAETPLVLNTHYTFAFVPGVGGAPGSLTITLLDHALAVLAPADVLTVAYTATVTGAAPNQDLFNRATFNASSLPGAGAIKTTGLGAPPLSEATDERTAYLTAEVRTYHRIYGILERSKGVKNELTPADGGGAADTYRYNPDATTRATIGELVTYQARLKLPPFVTLYDLRFQDNVPDGLTVRSIKWELVPRDGELTGAALDITIPAESSGVTPVNHLHTSGTNPFPAIISGGAAPGRDVLVEITATVDQQLNSGTTIAAQNFSNTATFSWANYPSGTRTSLATDLVAFSARVPYLDPANVTKAAVEFRRADGLSVFTPSTATVVNRLSGSPAFRGIADNANATAVRLVAPGEFVRYRISLRNTGTAAAYAVQLYDVVPRTGAEDFTVGPAYGLEYTDNGGLLPPTVTATAGATAILVAPAFVQNELTLTLDQVAPGATVEVFFWMRVKTGLAASLHFGNRARVTDYRTLPTTGVFDPAAARTSSSAPVPFTAIPFAAARDVGLATAAPTFTTTYQSHITEPSPGAELSADTGRATIGEEIVLRQTIDIPANLALYEWLPRHDLTGHVVDAWVVPSGLTVRRATLTFGNGSPIDIPVAPHAASGSTRISRPASLVGAPAGYPDLIAANIPTPGGEPELTLTVYATVNVASLAASPIRIVNGPGSATIVDAGDTLSFVPLHRWAQWDGIAANLNQLAAPARSFGIVEPAILNASFTKTRLTAPTAGTGIGFNNFYGEGPLTPAPTNPVPSVPLFTHGDVITYRIQYTNTGAAPAYGVAVIDRIPAGLAYDAASAVIVSETGGVAPTTGAVLAEELLPPVNAHYSAGVRFTIDRLDPGETLAFTYTATVNDPVAVGRYLQNRADLVDYSTLPAGYVSAHVPPTANVIEANERDTDSANPYADRGPVWAYAGIADNNVSSKTIRTELTAPSGKLSNGSSRAAPGELVTYELTVDIPAGRVLHDFYLHDQLPDGMTIVPSLTTYELNGVSGLTAGQLNDGNRRYGLFLGDLVGTAAANELVVTLRATVDLVLDSAPSTPLLAGATLSNSFTFSWNQVDQDPDPVVNLTTDARTTVNSVPVGPVTLQLQEPNLNGTLAKTQANVREAGTLASAASSRGAATFYKFTGGVPAVTERPAVEVTLPDDYIVYTLTVGNNGTTHAFDIRLADLLPPDDGVTYVSGTGTVTAGSALAGTHGAAFTGTAGSRLTVATVADTIDGHAATLLDLHIDFLAPGDTATIKYAVRVKQGVGAGHYLGANAARLADYGTLPEAELAVTVGNLAANTLVHDNSLERDSDTPAPGAPYSDQGPVEREIGVQWPALAKTVVRLYDDHGAYAPSTVAPGDVLRVGELLVTSLDVTLPRRTVLFDGGAAALRFRDVLPAGQTYVAETVDAIAYPHYGLSPAPGATAPTLDLGPAFSAIATPAAAGVQTVNINFADIANPTDNPLTGTINFLTEIKPLAADNSTNLLAATTAQLTGLNTAHLFWNTHDTRTQRQTHVASASPALSDDVPWLRALGPQVHTRQPNLALAKTATPADGTIIGSTNGVGDEVVYTVTLANAAPGSFSHTAYHVTLTDLLPRHLAPQAPAATLTPVSTPPASIAANQLTVTVGGRQLVPSDDYTFVYTPDSATLRGAFTIVTKQRADHSYPARIQAGETLAVTYKLDVDPEIGAEGSGVGLMANRAEVPPEGYHSFPEALNDPDRKSYGPLGPAVHTLLPPTPAITKTAVPAPASSVSAGNIITYTLTAPASVIKATLYGAELRDVLPDGLAFVTAGTVTAPAGTVVLNPGGPDEITVTGGTGNVTITIAPDLRTLTVLIEQIDEQGSGSDQVVVTLKARVKPDFDNGAPIPRLHGFDNYAELYWYNSPDAGFAGRARYLVLSDKVTHYYDAYGILLEPDHTGTALPGEVKSYRHVLRNFESAPATVTLAWDTTLGWNWLFYSADGQGNITDGTPRSTGHVVTIPANGSLEFVMQAFVPAPATAFTTDVLSLTATAALPSAQVITVYDTTTVQSPGVVITKDISKDGGSTFDTRLAVDSAGEIIQRLRFQNNSPGGVRSVYVYDFIPPHTVYVANSATDTGTYALGYSTDGGVSWTNGEPGNPAAVTNLRWLYDGGNLLIPGEVHTIEFKLKVK